MLRNLAKSAARRAATEALPLSKPGDSVHGFTLLRTKHVPELELTALHLKHDKTGAEHLHIAREDSNNVFSIGFKTNPPNDTGVPHILEHTTLCGGQKYPVRDPFFKMLPRTLANFMNAFTASDHTYYPFATTNSQDFKNLLSVYLDATLKPLLRKFDFMQEGWRVGPENPQALVAGTAKPEDKTLVFKGVVYNEMKGQMSDAGYLYYIRFQDHIFPAINNSGGDPQKITDLTYCQLISFHQKHYHPSNAKVFTYGDMSLNDHLAEIRSMFDGFEQSASDAENHRPVDLSSGPQDVTINGPVDLLVGPNKQYKTSVSWVLGETSNIVESFSLSLLSALLTDGYGSPLYKGLIESGLGADWSPNTGYDGSAKLGIFSLGLSGVQEADVPRVKSEIHKILRNVRGKGFEQSKIDGYLHQLELSLKHKTANFGVSLLQRLKGKWFVGVDPIDSLAWNDTVAAFGARLAKGDYLEQLMDKYLLNDKTFTFTMAPSTTYNDELAQEEARRLAAKVAEASEALGSAQKAQDEFENLELALLAEQEKEHKEAPATEDADPSPLPTVHVKDIPRQKESVVLRTNVMGRVKTSWREAPTNGLTYFRALDTLDKLPYELRVMVPLFIDAIFRLGTRDMSMEELEDLIKLKTGGISVAYHSSPSLTDFTESSEALSFTGMALDRNVPAMLDLLRKVVLETNFDSPEAAQQIRQLLQTSADGVVNEIASSGHSYARLAAEAGLTRGLFLKEQISGLSQIQLVTSLATRPDSDQLQDVIAKLKQIQRLAFAGSMRTLITCGAESVQTNTQALSAFVSSLPTERSVRFGRQQTLDLAANLKTFYPLPYQVYYGSLAVPTTSYVSSDSAPLRILSQLLTHKHLHYEIREKGGAYGGGAYSRPLDGVFGFYSYRDPSPQNTIKIMQNAGQWAVDKKWQDRDFEEAKISLFQGVDAPQSVNGEGLDVFLHGMTPEIKQQQRERLLDVTKDKVREVAQKYLVDALQRKAGRLVFLGEKRDWVDASWKVNTMNMNDSS